MKFSPKQFLKTRRPEQFSDSEIISESLIDRTILEFYLDTLANRSQEVEFERFGIRLCKAAISPNLLPNTGPTGGGDGKVDSETYPVSDTTTLGWFTCVDKKAASERWGFAFSVQKDWGTKVREDVKKAYKTGRNYKVAYFVSSRSIRASDKARVQDELSKKFNIDVRILDRNWILDEVFENKREDIVKEELGVDRIAEPKVKKGPLDLQRGEDLDALDKKIETALSENKKDSSAVDDAIRSAILSRELERPRVEIDGRFDRAERLAQECGSVYQQFEVAYQLAWTTFWWHEDFSTYIDTYQKVEERVINTDNIYNLERLTNLWYLLNNVYQRDKELVDKDFFNIHSQILKNKLVEISKEKEEKPSAALYAKTLLLEIELAERRFSGQEIGKTLINLKEVVTESKYLIGFPFKPLIQILTEISEALEDNPEYKDLFQTILQVTEERDGELAAAKLLLDRGEKLIRLARPYEAIQGLGNSLRKLYKHESREEAVRALYLIGIAYEQVGLFWAARGALLSAASLATSEFWNYGEINAMQAACYKRLKWLELRLGRIPQALDWHRLDHTVRNILMSKGYDQKKLFEQFNRFDMALGILFLRSDLETLRAFEYWPDTLFELGLDYSPVALIYALGCVDKIPKDFMEAVPSEEFGDFFSQWAQQYSPEYLPPAIISTEKGTIQLTSKILGCDVITNIENKRPCLEVAESILSAIESFLSTATLRHAAAREPIIEINIDASGENDLIDYTIDDGGEKPIILVHCKQFNPHSVSHTDQERPRDIIFNIMAETTGRLVIFKNPNKELEEIMRDERALERALNFTSSFVTLGNVLGHEPKTKISEWIDVEKERYELKRKEPLSFPRVQQETSGDGVYNPLSRAKHTDIQVISVIRDALWDQAKWLGVGYMVMPNREAQPILGILFENIEAGKKIFAAWRKKFGERDQNEEIRITIVKGIDRNNPYHYKVGIGSNIKAFEKERDKGSSRFFSASTRIHVMTPQSFQNLDNFKLAYDCFGSYFFAPGSMGKDGLPNVISDLALVKKEINFKEAWEIRPNSIDSVLVSPEDRPIIPPDIENPPILELLKSKNGPFPRKLER